jgi:hypothetical protein
MLKESREMPALDTARHNVVHAAEPRLGQSPALIAWFLPRSISFIL